MVPVMQFKDFGSLFDHFPKRQKYSVHGSSRKATVVYDCGLYPTVSTLQIINLQLAYLNCISLNETEFRSWSLSVNDQCAPFKA